MIHLYAIAQGLGDVPDGAGIGGEPLRRLEVDDVAAVFSSHDAAPPEPDEQAVLAHAAAVEALLGASDALLPARFGRAFANEGALEAAVREQLDDLRPALARARGHVEFGVRVLGADDEPAPEAGSGRAYMQARLDARARAERIAGSVHEPLARFAAASTSSTGGSGRLFLSGAYLVPADAIEGFRAVVGELEAAHPELTFVCTGPWPPYSFAT
ncbi:MAG TPA: GvpL/GvpF family gas vesicle protein [Gaiellaceae bacterium]